LKERNMIASMTGSRSLAAWVVAGALGTGMGTASMAETNWGALSAADWNGEQMQEDERIAQSGGGIGAGDDWGTAIQKAFVELGMAAPRAECYGKVLAANLSPEEQQAAAELVDAAATPEDVKMGVISGGPEIVGGFSAANVRCPESMGG
jgi:hypothetical protein